MKPITLAATATLAAALGLSAAAPADACSCRVRHHAVYRASYYPYHHRVVRHVRYVRRWNYYPTPLSSTRVIYDEGDYAPTPAYEVAEDYPAYGAYYDYGPTYVGGYGGWRGYEGGYGWRGERHWDHGRHRGWERGERGHGWRRDHDRD